MFYPGSVKSMVFMWYAGLILYKKGEGGKGRRGNDERGRKGKGDWKGSGGSKREFSLLQGSETVSAGYRDISSGFMAPWPSLPRWHSMLAMYSTPYNPLYGN